MKGLVEVAMVGLERAGAPGAADAGDELIAQLGELPAERALLLRAGVAAVRARAGRRAVERRPPAPAPEEARPLCSDALGNLVAELCAAGSTDLLAEALARMDARGLRLPPWHLVALAEVRSLGKDLARHAARVAGERGRWLAAQDPAWRRLAGSDVPESAEARRRTWEEGELPARLAVLAAVRAEDPAEGRRWVEGVWREEKADVREELLAALDRELQPEDEPFLVSTLKDRAASVRARAVRLLARIEGSALAGRMRARADVMLSELSGEASAGALVVQPPESFGEGWAEDGLVEKAPPGVGARAFWLRQVVGLVPPGHWEQRFGASPEALVASAARTDWAFALLEGFRDAAMLFRAPAWAAALWRQGVSEASGEAQAARQLVELARQLFPLLSLEEAEASVRPLLAPEKIGLVQQLLLHLRAPWSPSFGGEVLELIHRGLPAGEPAWPELFAWNSCLEIVARSVPPGCFARALSLEPPAAGGPNAGQLRSGVEQFRSVVSIRQRIHEETR